MLKQLKDLQLFPEQGQDKPASNRSSKPPGTADSRAASSLPAQGASVPPGRAFEHPPATAEGSFLHGVPNPPPPAGYDNLAPILYA